MIDPLLETQKLYMIVAEIIESLKTEDTPKSVLPFIKEARSLLQNIFVMQTASSKHKESKITYERDKYDIRRIINKLPDDMKARLFDILQKFDGETD